MAIRNINIKVVYYLFLGALLTLIIISCRVTQPYDQPGVNTTNLYRDINTTDTASIATLPYTEIFTDTILQRLIAQGIANNPDLLVAYTRIEQANATYQQSLAAFYPTLNGNASVTTSHVSGAKTPGVQTNSVLYGLGLSSTWEADIWGQLRSSRRADLASLLQTQAAARAVQTGLVADIANDYYTLLALDQQLQITRQTVANWDTTVQVFRALKEAARVTEAAVVQSEAQRYAAEVTIPDLQRSIRETENALSILIGLPPGPIDRSTLDAQQLITVLQTGVPAQLLSNRPDVQEAELNYRYYFELTNVARTYFYPALTITASSGLSAFALSNILQPGSLVANLTAGFTQPILNHRANRTRLEIAQAQQQGALIDFKNTLLNAGREVSDALYLYQSAEAKRSIRTNEIVSLNQSVSYTQELLRYGFATYTEVITARQSLLQAQLGSINDRLQQLQATVNLYRSVGGGWR